jgi:4-hydroxy-3-methylbut-2-enyl diphosphate reductase
MKVTVAKTAGFCFGVKRAVDEVFRQADEGDQPVFTFGPVIHNEQVMDQLKERGVRVIGSKEELSSLKKGTIIIRAHGVGWAVEEKLRATPCKIVDATCPFVKKIHAIVSQASRDGLTVLIAGDPRHPEVRGIRGWAREPVYILQNREELEALSLPKDARAILVAQTTFNLQKFQEMVEIFKEKRYYGRVVNTVCNATAERQTEALQISGAADAMLVIGGRHSSNTQKLYEICRTQCRNTYFIETLVDLENKPFQSFCHVGITAGASTPHQIIEEVQEKLCQK